MKNFRFEKENDGRWYVILPEWEGDHEELEMVAGADILMDSLSKDGKTCDISISEEPIENAVELILDRPASGGGVYKVFNNPAICQVWLCHVTRFIYNGRLPKALYFVPN